ncbi:MAG: T9SS type A sorting domain-containing protein, partial [Flavobacteriales bacterium]|nr:T9SS type A sorting domain-containing protein [Flavobacteriales bacterium]
YQFTGVTALTNGRRFTLGTVDRSNTPLPITLLDLKAEALADACAVNIRWTTATELDNELFVVERSTDLNAWATVGELPGVGTSNTVRDYSLPDRETIPGDLYYRLRQVDIDGTMTLSDAVHTHVACRDEPGMEAYPNPTTGQLQVQWRSADTAGRLVLVDAMGRTVRIVSVGRDMERTAVAMEDLPPGLYHLLAEFGGHVASLTVVRS